MTIRELAKLANVSASTVSKIFNDKADDISDETKRRVLDLAREYNYHPQNERGAGRSFEIVIVIYQKRIHLDEIIIFFSKWISKAGYSMSVVLYSTSQELLEKLRIVRSRKYDAVIVDFYLDSEDILIDKELKNLKVVITGGEVKSNFDIIKCYIENYKATTEKAVKYLISQGHHDIGLIYNQNFYADEILNGYKKALADNDNKSDAKYLCLNNNKTNHQIYKLINQNVSALICETFEQAAFVYQSCARHGVRIPQDLSVVCLDDSINGNTLQPALCNITENIEYNVWKCVDQVIQILEGKSCLNADALKKAGKSIIVNAGESVWSFYNKKRHLGSILVIGSMNIDETVHINRIPADGETQLAFRRYSLTGGKGANQAVGISNLGGKVYLMGCVGNDFDGRKIISYIKKKGVYTDAIRIDNESSTGKAYIYAVARGQNTIVVYPGANSLISSELIRQNEEFFKKVSYCLIPIEISEEPALYALKCCKKNNVITIVKPSLMLPLKRETLSIIDFLIPNEKEIQCLVHDGNDYCEKAEWLLKQGVKNVIVTLGDKGCYLKNHEYSLLFPAANFVPVDTTGAADAFIATLVSYLNEGYELITSIVYALFGAGISITKEGVQSAMPDKMALEMYHNKVLEYKNKWFIQREEKDNG